jgi:hypothetical protein
LLAFKSLILSKFLPVIISAILASLDYHPRRNTTMTHSSPLQTFNSAGLRRFASPAAALRSLLTLAMILACTTVARAQELIIAEGGKSDYQIVLPDKSPDAQIAGALAQTARLLQAAFLANGVEINITPEAARDTAKPGIFLGATAFSAAQGIDSSKLVGWSYLHQVAGKNVIILGSDRPAMPPFEDAVRNVGASSFNRVATAKGVVDFLQQYVGTRFLYPEQGGWNTLANLGNVDFLKSPTIEYLPTPKIAVPANLKITKRPVMEADVTYPPATSFYHLAQNRFPVVDFQFNAGHTYHRAIPPNKENITAHPEYFALINGKRLTQEGSDAAAQYCISNPQVQELFYQDIERHLKLGFRSVEIGQPDGFSPCQCEPCGKLFNTGSDWSEKLWILHRNLAERAYKAFPDRTIVISSYMDTETLPKTFKVFPPNVNILLCGTNESDLAKWKEYQVPQGFTAYVYYWCPNQVPLYMPQRTPTYVEQAAKRLMGAKVRAIVRDGNGGLSYGLEGPVYYTFGKMFDGNPSHNAGILVNEFVTASFGKAASPMQRFYEQLYHANEIYAQFLGTRDPAWAYLDMNGRGRKILDEPTGVLAFLYPVELIGALETQLAAAEKADTSPKVAARLALVRREFDWVKQLMNAVHLYKAYQASPDTASLDRLLTAIESRRAEVDKLFVTAVPGGWPYNLYPPTGHVAQHLNLDYDDYQRPYKSSFLGWNVAARRQAPLLNAKRMLAGPNAGGTSLEEAQWDRIPAQKLVTVGAPASTALPTQVRASFDANNFYLLFDSQLPANASPEAIAQERVEAYLMPVAGSGIMYRFSAGLAPDSRTQAARGLIADGMNLLHGKFDPMWNGEWTHLSRLDPKTQKLQTLFTIPLKTLGNATTKEHTIWYVNFRRTAANPKDKSLVQVWSNAEVGGDIEDPRSNGEMSFFREGGSASSSNIHPNQIWREKYVKDTFEVPVEWRDAIAKGPSVPLTGWVFRSDGVNQGIKQEWFNPAKFVAADWVSIKVPSMWAENETVGELMGYGWYRVAFTLPANWPDKGVRLLFGSVDEQAWVYVNGKQVGEHSEKSENKRYTELWEAPFVVDVPKETLKKGDPNVLYVRVHNDMAAGGIWRSVNAIPTP